MSILQNSNAISAGGYDINNSLRFRSSASAYLNRTPASAGNQKTWTWSGWVKRGALGIRGGLFGAVDTYIQFIASDVLEINLRAAATNYIWTTNQVFRDPSAWYHIVLAVDTTQATATNRMLLYVNGVQVTSFASSATIPQNTDTRVNSTALHTIGSYNATTDYLDGYQTEVNFVNGLQLTPSSFGSTNAITGVWQPAKYTGTYGTNGFYLNFSNIALTSGSNTGLGKDYSGNGNYWNTNNISVTSGTTYDAMTDVPTNTSATVANYAVINPLTLRSGTGTVSVTTSNANMTWNFQTSGASPVNYMVSGTVGMSSGKWYWEVTPTTITATTGLLIGVGANPYSSTNFWNTAGNSTEYMYISNNGNKANNNVSSAYGATYTTNDVIGVALDMDAGTLTFYKNNVSQGTAYTGLSGTYFPFLACPSSAATDVVQVNFGQRPFTYTPPTGYVALNTYNLPTPTILQGNKYMDATLYTGTGTALNVVNAGQFKPDFVWVKQRSGVVRSHRLEDSVRGATKALYSDLTDAETTEANSITAFNSNGFSVNSQNGVGNSGETYVAWQWQAGQGSTSSNTNGSITSTVSVNTTAGFSICSYTAPAGGGPFTVGHGLGVAPKFIIVKNRDGATDEWAVYHDSLGNTKDLVLNSTVAAQTLNFWNSTSPTSTVFSIGTRDEVDRPNNKMIAYCFAEIAGFSKFGSYTGNGSADGPFVFTNFRPKFIMIKSTATANAWHMTDTSRSVYNTAVETVWANESSAESTSSTQAIDVLSNGFKIRNSTSEVNNSGTSMIYMAFAENPFKNSNAR